MCGFVLARDRLTDTRTLSKKKNRKFTLFKDSFNCKIDSREDQVNQPNNKEAFEECRGVSICEARHRQSTTTGVTTTGTSLEFLQLQILLEPILSGRMNSSLGIQNTLDCEPKLLARVF